jgi:hypothetical protein
VNAVDAALAPPTCEGSVGPTHGDFWRLASTFSVLTTTRIALPFLSVVGANMEDGHRLFIPPRLWRIIAREVSVEWDRAKISQLIEERDCPSRSHMASGKRFVAPVCSSKARFL